MNLKIAGMILATFFFCALDEAESTDRGGQTEILVSGGAHQILNTVGGFEPDPEGMISGSLGHHVGTSHLLSGRFSMAFYPGLIKGGSANYQYNFRATENWIPYLGAGFGIQSLGAVTDGSKFFISVVFGLRRYFGEKGLFFFESRGLSVSDKDIDGSSKTTSWNQLTVGFGILF